MNIQGGMQGAAVGSTFGVPGAIAGGILGLTGFLGDNGEGAREAAAQQAAANIAAQERMNTQNIQSQEGINNRNITEQQNWNKQVDPFSTGGNREQYVSQLNTLMQGGPSSVSQDPMFQKLNEQSLGNVERRMSAQGLGASGQEMAALRDTGFGNQMNFFNSQYDRLASLSGATRGGGQAATGSQAFRGTAPQGQNPQDIYNQIQGNTQSNINAFSGFMGGLDNIFGGGSENMSASNMWNAAGTPGAWDFLKNG